MILKILRNALGSIIVFFSWLTLPKPIQRNEADQKEAEMKASQLKLYQLYACPFCVKTRRAIHRLNLPIETRGIEQGSQYREEIEREGGKIQAPCLKIQTNDGVQWMYESSDIIDYLEAQFDEVDANKQNT